MNFISYSQKFTLFYKYFQIENIQTDKEKEVYLKISLCTVLYNKFSLVRKAYATIWLKILISRMIKLQFSPLNIAIIEVSITEVF